MALITDPDNLLDAGIDSAQNIFINTAARTIKIRNNSAAPSGPELSNDGVTHQALYSFLKEQWKNDPKNKSLIAYPFPLIAITPEQFEWRFGWTPADDSSRSLLRTGGWREIGTDDATLKRQYLGTISLGNIQGTPTQGDAGTINQHKVYYAFFDSADGSATAGPFNYDYAGEVNQAVQIYDSTDIAKDYRGDILRLFIRSQPYAGVQNDKAWTFDQTDTVDIGITAGTQLGYNVQRFPLAEGEDLNILERINVAAEATQNLTDAIISANEGAAQKYSWTAGPRITYRSATVTSDTLGYTQDLLVPARPFGITIDASTPVTDALSSQELYGWVQYKLRQDSDIEFEPGTAKIGKLQDELLAFVGSTLTTKLATNTDRFILGQNAPLKSGTAITTIRATDINNTQLRDDSDTLRSFPFSSTVTISFSNDILTDSDKAKAFVYYDYTRSYSGTSITLANVGAAAGDATKDSANFTLAGYTTTPLLRTGTPNGLNTTGGAAADAYFRVVGGTASNGVNNTIFGVTTIFDSNNFAAITLDDTPVIQAETITTNNAIRTHPINSPSALLIDSAGAPIENSGGVVKVLGTGGIYGGTDGLNASDQIVFTYAYDGNTQKDRVAGADVAANVRAIGLGSGTWVETTATIGRVNNNPISVISSVERNYDEGSTPSE